MAEDFGDWGDEQFLNLCAEDWRDYAPLDAEENHSRQVERRQVDEDEVDNERDLCDIVREYEENLDEETEEYYDCEWEE